MCILDEFERKIYHSLQCDIAILYTMRICIRPIVLKCSAADCNVNLVLHLCTASDKHEPISGFDATATFPTHTEIDDKS